MLACDETITLVHHIAEQDDDLYVCTTIQGASWHTVERVMLQEHGFARQSETKVRIPESHMPEGVLPEVDGWLVRGDVIEIKSQVDLQAYEHIRIMAVGDNRRGGLPHWAVSGE